MKLSRIDRLPTEGHACLRAAMSDNVRRLSLIIPGSWRSLLKNVSQARPASKVFSSKVLPAGSANLPAVLSFEFWRPAVRRKQISCRGRRLIRNGSITLVIV